MCSMAEQTQTEYEQYAPQTNGRLFSNAMFGFNKEQVLEYLEELAEENKQRQEMATQRVQELDRKVKQMEAGAVRTQQMLQEQQAMGTDEALQGKLEELTNALQISRDAGMQAEDELAEAKEKLFTLQNENNWLREEHQKTDKHVAELRRQLDEASQGQWFGAEEQIATLRRREEEAMQVKGALQQERDLLLQQLKSLEAERDAIEAERDAAEAERDAAEAERDAAEAERDAAEAENELLLATREGARAGEYEGDLQTTRQLVQEATQEAEHVRKLAYAERERLQKQLRSSAGGLVDNIGCIREDITAVEGEVTTVLETVQNSLAELLVSLSHTEQSLGTLDIQIERFPASSPGVAKREALHMRPLVTQQEEQAHLRQNAKDVNRLGVAEFQRVWPRRETEKGKVQYFRPGFSNVASANYAQTARVLPQRQVHASEDLRMRELTETLVETLRQMMV